VLYHVPFCSRLPTTLTRLRIRVSATVETIATGKSSSGSTAPDNASCLDLPSHWWGQVVRAAGRASGQAAEMA